jgi:hypothetical protein
VASDKDGNLRQDTRPALIGQQLLDVDGNTAVQGSKESSYRFLEAVTNPFDTFATAAKSTKGPAVKAKAGKGTKGPAAAKAKAGKGTKGPAAASPTTSKPTTVCSQVGEICSVNTDCCGYPVDEDLYCTGDTPPYRCLVDGPSACFPVGEICSVNADCCGYPNAICTGTTPPYTCDAYNP